MARNQVDRLHQLLMSAVAAGSFSHNHLILSSGFFSDEGAANEFRINARATATGFDIIITRSSNSSSGDVWKCRIKLPNDGELKNIESIAVQQAISLIEYVIPSIHVAQK